MVTIHISDELGKQLQRIAETEDVSIDQIAETLIQQYVDTKQTEHAIPDKSRNLFALILEASDRLDLRSGRSDISETGGDPLRLVAQAADELGLRSTKGNVSEHSRDILDTEFADDLKRRIHEQD